GQLAENGVVAADHDPAGRTTLAGQDGACAGRLAEGRHCGGFELAGVGLAVPDRVPGDRPGPVRPLQERDPVTAPALCGSGLRNAPEPDLELLLAPGVL